MKRYTVVFVSMIVAIAMMIGVQSVLAAKREEPVIGIANGTVTAFGGNVGSWPSPGSDASGTWKMVVHDPIGDAIVNFSATCRVGNVVYKVSYNGPGSLDVNGAAVITVESVTVKSKGEVWSWGTSEIVVDELGMTLDITDNDVINVIGETNLFKPVPPFTGE